MARAISQEEHEKRLELYRQGLTDKEVAIAVGLKSAQNIHSWRKRHGLKANHAPVAVAEKTGKCTLENSSLSEVQKAAMRQFLARFIQRANHTQPSLYKELKK